MLVPKNLILDKDENTSVENISVLGSTGSIGKSTLEIIYNFPDKFKVHSLVARSNWKLLLEQCKKFNPKFVVLEDSKTYQSNREQIESELPSGTELLHGSDAINDVAADPDVSLVLMAVLGIAALRPTLCAIAAGKKIAIANKECIVSGGKLLKEALLRNPEATLVPVDSEHSAIFQALQGNFRSDINKLILTSSGGPFLKLGLEELSNIKPQDAIKHPNWQMGHKISVDSATMMNKALEVIEAQWLFGVDLSKIEVLIHPQSIIHSLVEYCDGTQIAQLSVPDMSGAIAYALQYPNGRLSGVMQPLLLQQVKLLDFIELPDDRFPAVSIAKRCATIGGTAPAAFNLANELAVGAFLGGKLKFDRIVPFVDQVLSEGSFHDYSSVEDLEQLDSEIRETYKL